MDDAMSRPERVHNFGTYFITTSCWQKRRVLQMQRNVELLLETIEGYRADFLLHEYVIMPDHIHLILTPQNITLDRAMQNIKGGFSHSLNKLGPRLPVVWQRGFTDHRIRDDADFMGHRKYIHNNPVTARLAGKPEDYIWSSAASSCLRLDPYLRG
jgi:putative transposase